MGFIPIEGVLLMLPDGDLKPESLAAAACLRAVAEALKESGCELDLRRPPAVVLTILFLSIGLVDCVWRDVIELAEELELRKIMLCGLRGPVKEASVLGDASFLVAAPLLGEEILGLLGFESFELLTDDDRDVLVTTSFDNEGGGLTLSPALGGIVGNFIGAGMGAGDVD